MKKASFLIFSFLILPIAGSVIINSTKAKWTGPSGPPTTYNVPAPLHIGDTNQTKKGGLTLGKDLWLDNFVSGAAQAGIKFFSNDSTFPRAGYLYNNAGTLIYQTDDGQGNQIPRFSIGNDGNVTIGNIQNQAKLHVDGDIRARNIYQNGKLVLTSETDPQVGILATNAFCTSDGNKIDCTTATIPETDPTIGTLNPNNWCISDGSKITCNASPPVTKEQDPEVGVLVSGKYCKATTAPDGTKRIDCSSDLQASDPRIGTIIPGKICAAVGGVIDCTYDSSSVSASYFYKLFGWPKVSGRNVLANKASVNRLCFENGYPGEGVIKNRSGSYTSEKFAVWNGNSWQFQTLSGERAITSYICFVEPL